MNAVAERSSGGEPSTGAAAENEPRWLLLIHQLPHKPQYTRVKVWRRLRRLGAITIKNTVYALPASEQAREDLEWVVREIAEAHGEAFIIEARFVHGLRDAEIEAMFNAARDAEYHDLREEVQKALRRLPKRGRPKADQKNALEAELERFKDRLADISSIDFFSASGREAVWSLASELESRLLPEEPKPVDLRRGPLSKLKDRTWVTRRNIFVDRIASGWLVRRFVDPKARFKYVAGKGYQPEAGEIRFDMYEAEYTHEGDRCTFEVLVDRLGIEDRALRPIAEIVHDIDIKDEKFGRAEAAGIESLLAGIASTSEDDDQRLLRGSRVFEDLYEYFRRKRS